MDSNRKHEASVTLREKNPNTNQQQPVLTQPNKGWLQKKRCPRGTQLSGALPEGRGLITMGGGDKDSKPAALEGQRQGQRAHSPERGSAATGARDSQPGKGRDKSLGQAKQGSMTYSPRWVETGLASLQPRKGQSFGPWGPQPIRGRDKSLGGQDKGWSPRRPDAVGLGQRDQPKQQGGGKKN